MNQTLTSFATSQIPRFLILLLGILFSFQQGNAQHCHPGFHFTVNGSTVVFEDVSTADGNITSYHWDFGDGNTSTEQNPTHTYASPGTYNVCLTITAHNPNCSATFCHHVVVTHPPHECHASFIANQPDLNQPAIDFTDQSTADGVIVSWEWDFGDGSTSTEQNPTHTYAAPGTYLVCLTIYDDDGGCTSHVCHHIQVNHPPAGDCHAAFIFNLDASGFGVQFTNTSTGTTAHTTYFWDFGDGTTSTEEDPHHAYAHAGHYTVCLFIEDLTIGCASHICHAINVHHNGHQHFHNPHHQEVKAVSALNDESATVHTISTTELMTIHPNPAVDFVKIVYQIRGSAKVKFEIYSLTGAKVAALPESVQAEGDYTQVFSVANLMSGVYILKMTVDGAPYIKQIVVQR
ncbi:MAG: PKD domain-containing protein [Chitinophagales bacterium]|nr:PKD domain-containing protein [Chitinophagales bacterium]